MQRQKSEYVIQTVDKAIQVLRVLAAKGELGVTELGKMLHMHKNNVFRVLATLEHEGLVRQSGERRYRLGVGTFELGMGFKRWNPLARRAGELLEAVAQETGESAHVAVLDSFEVVHVRGRRSQHVLASELREARRLPCHSTALGKVLLGCSPEEVRSHYDRAVVAGGGLAPCTPSTIVDREKLFEHLRTVGGQGWAIDWEECEPGLACAAAPVFDETGLAGALSVSGPTCRLDRDRLEREIVPMLQERAEQLSRELGYAAG